jgi:hypothetical protein
MWSEYGFKTAHAPLPVSDKTGGKYVADPAEQDRLETLQALFTVVDGMRSQLPRPEAESSLGRDDAKTDPYHLSHLVGMKINIALDQIHALDNLVTKAESLHPYAIFPLIRSAIENAATALWLLQPGNRTERVTRRWRLANMESTYIENFHRSTGGELPTAGTAGERLAIYTELAARGGVTGKLPRATSTDILQEIEAKIGPDLSIEAAWQICSGITHGQQWAVVNLLDLEFQPTLRKEWHGTKVTAGVQQVLWGAGCAYKVLDSAVNLYARRCRAVRFIGVGNAGTAVPAFFRQGTNDHSPGGAAQEIHDPWLPPVLS